MSRWKLEVSEAECVAWCKLTALKSDQKFHLRLGKEA